MSIIISQDGKNAQKIDKLDIKKEGYLQNYIHENPESIPVYEIEEDKKLLVVAREYGTESGPIDALAIDKDGDIYVVETKLYKNPDKRMVVAQALDYGASLWRHSNFDEFMAEINNEINEKFSISFEEKTKEFFNIDDEQIVIMFEAIKRNLQQGNIKFVVLMDLVEDRLKDLIVYINQNSQFDIYAVQMEYYEFEKYKIIIPKLFGVEVKKGVRIPNGSSQRISWNEEGFMAEIEKLKFETKNKILALLDFAKKEKCLEGWGTGKNPNFNFKIKNPNGDGQTTVFSVWGNGFIQIGFWLVEHELDKQKSQIINEFFEKINNIKGMQADKKQTRMFNFPVDVVDNEGIREFEKCVLWLKEEIK